jgi:hypothetical protein
MAIPASRLFQTSTLQPCRRTPPTDPQQRLHSQDARIGTEGVYGLPKEGGGLSNFGSGCGLEGRASNQNR